MKPIRLSFAELPEAAYWKVGKTYRVKFVLKQVGQDESGASFDLIDANSLESTDRDIQRFIHSEGGYMKLK